MAGIPSCKSVDVQSGDSRLGGTERNLNSSGSCAERLERIKMLGKSSRHPVL